MDDAGSISSVKLAEFTHLGKLCFLIANIETHIINGVAIPSRLSVRLMIDCKVDDELDFIFAWGHATPFSTVEEEDQHSITG
jgi:hypothetical protein